MLRRNETPHSCCKSGYSAVRCNVWFGVVAVAGSAAVVMAVGAFTSVDHPSCGCGSAVRGRGCVPHDRATADDQVSRVQ